MPDIVETLATLDSAPAAAARVRLRVTGRGRGAAPVCGPSGRALTSIAVSVPLSDSDRAQLEDWASEAAGAAWPDDGCRVRLDLEDGAGATVAGWSRTWSPAQLTGRAPTPGGASARPPWLHPPAAPSALDLGAAAAGADAGALLQLVAGVLKLNESITMASLQGYQRLASEAVAQSGQTARTQAAQLGGVTSTVAKTAADAAADRREAEAERAAALQVAGEQAAAVAALEARLEAAKAAPPDDAGATPRDRLLERGLGILGAAVAGGAVRLERTGPGLEPAARGVDVLPAPPPADDQAPAAAPASAEAPTLDADLQAGAAGDQAARARVRARLRDLGGLAALAWAAAEDG